MIRGKRNPQGKTSSYDVFARQKIYRRVFGIENLRIWMRLRRDIGV